MNLTSLEMAEYIENAPLFKSINIPLPTFARRLFILKEIQSDCLTCGLNKPFHNTDRNNYLFSIRDTYKVEYDVTTFRCVTCQKDERNYWLRSEEVSENTIILTKVGQYPQKELPKSKSLSKFFKADKDEYHKANVCIANGYGVAAFAYMRRIVENNISSLLELIQEGVDADSDLSKSLTKLKTTSPMSEKIKIANNALPDYLKPDGFNPLGQIYGLLSDGVHSLSDDACLNKAENLQACLEFLIGELATHKKNKEDFKKRLSALKG